MSPPASRKPPPGGDPRGYPWGLEREALGALERRDVEDCRGSLLRLAREIGSGTGPAPSALPLLLADLLARLARSLRPSASDEADPAREAGASRLRRAERLGEAGTDRRALRAVFQEEADALFSPPAGGMGLNPGVMRAQSYLDRHYTRRVTLRQLADDVHLSPNYLSSIFRREIGLTVTQYLRARRMQLAEKLLLEGQHTISEIAYQVGYQNYRDFHRNFVRAGGRSPRAFQRLCRRRGNPAPGPSP